MGRLYSEEARARSRLPVLTRAGDMAAVELAMLLLLGAAAALATLFLKPPLRIPGSSIVFGILPTALAVALGFGGARMPGAGATASLVLAGPLLDLALAAARSGWRLYVGFVLAGLVANLVAFAARAGFPALGHRSGGGGGGLPRGAGAGRALGGLGLRHALLTYAACGIVAGLLGAAAWFRFRPRATPGP